MSLATDDADQVMVVSTQPVVLGNDPGPESSAREGYEKVAFVGQTPTTVRGPVETGDLVVPSGENDGIARAVTPEDGPIIGQAWEGDNTDGISEVVVAVGIDDPSVVGAAVEADRERIDRLEAENERLRAENEQLRERIAAIEAQIGMDETAPTPADD